MDSEKIMGYTEGAEKALKNSARSKIRGIDLKRQLKKVMVTKSEVWNKEYLLVTSRL